MNPERLVLAALVALCATFGPGCRTTASLGGDGAWDTDTESAGTDRQADTQAEAARPSSDGGSESSTESSGDGPAWPGGPGGNPGDHTDRFPGPGGGCCDSDGDDTEARPEPLPPEEPWGSICQPQADDSTCTACARTACCWLLTDCVEHRACHCVLQCLDRQELERSCYRQCDPSEAGWALMGCVYSSCGHSCP